ncbi:MAG: 50S ribosomal protein L9 [Bacteroidetes bacterium]|nr:50S ribosomal protein L9 [Bacteroidota bacterium]MBU1720586.1 50S ribosomal protein L9 [Bacteroidota bacterium]
MELILIQDVETLGHKDDIVVVRDGYGRNFLIPQKRAILATPSAKKILAENLKQRAFKEDRIKKEATTVAESMKAMVVKVGAKVSSTGKIFGSVTTMQLAEAIEKQYKIQVDRKKITIKGDTVKEVGQYDANIKLHREVDVDFKFEVFAE